MNHTTPLHVVLFHAGRLWADADDDVDEFARRIGADQFIGRCLRVACPGVFERPRNVKGAAGAMGP